MKPLVVVFIARDTDEYEKYCRSAPGAERNFLSEWTEGSKSSDNIEAIARMIGGRIKSRISCYIFETRESDFRVFALDMGKYKEDAALELKKNSKISAEFKRQVDSTIGQTVGLAKDKYDKTVFIHWGGLNEPEKADEVDFYSLSSIPSRNALFDVTGNLFAIPLSRAEFNALVEKFDFVNKADKLLEEACLGENIDEAMMAADKLRKGVC